MEDLTFLRQYSPNWSTYPIQFLSKSQQPFCINWENDSKTKCDIPLPYNEIFSNKKEWSINTCYNTNESWKQYAKWNKLDIGHMWFHLYEMSKIHKSTEAERIVVA